VFLVTSVDSATFVLGMLSSDGAHNPPSSKKWSWGVALLLLGAGFTMTNNMDAIKALIVAGSIPFFGVLLLQVVAFARAIWRDSRP
jgi:glycine betaine transporter